MSDEDVAVDQDNAVAEPEEELSEEEQAMAKLKEAITVEREEIGSLRLKMSVTIPQDAMDERRGEQFLELKRDALIPGFRKGHAPMRLVEKRFATDVGEQLKSQLVGSGYLAAVEKEDLKPLGDPMFKVTVIEECEDEDGKPHKASTEKLLPIDEALDHIDMPKDGPLTFACELELKPEFELPKLEKIPVERRALSIGDEDVDGEVKRMLMMRGSFEPVEKGSVELDDMLYADMTMSVEGQTIATEKNFDLAARDLRIKGVPLEGFGAAVKGKKPGDKVTFEAPVPDDHENVDIRGKKAEFEFAILEIKRLKLPTLDKELLATIGFESKKELQDSIRSALESRLDAAVKEAMREQVGQYLVDETKLEIPEGLSQRQTDRSVGRRMIEMYQAGVPQAQIEKAMDEMRTKAHDQSVRDLKLFFILEKIADERDITVGEEELNGAIAQIAQRSNKRFDRVRDELSKGEGLTVLYHQLRDQRVLASLLEEAEITESKAEKRPAAKNPAAKKPAEKKTAAKEPAAKKPVAKKASPKKKTAKKKTGKS